MTTLTTITDQLTLVMLNINIWSGRKKLVPEDLQLASGAIPPEELVSLGSKRICDPMQLKPFHRLKQAAERACLKVGTRFLGGYAVPHDHTNDLAAKLTELEEAFATATQTFVAHYDRDLRDWIAHLPLFEEPIRAALEPVETVRKKLGFGFQMITFAPATQPGSLSAEVASLGDGIFAEVKPMARILKEAFAGKTKLHRSVLTTFGHIRNKMACLSFVDVRLQPIVEAIDDWLRRLPVDTPITGGLFTEGMGLAMLLADSEALARHGAGQWARQQQALALAATREPPSAEPEAEEPEALEEEVTVEFMPPPPVPTPLPVPSFFF